MRVKVGNPVFLVKFFEIPCRALRVHRLKRILLSKYIPADGDLCLIASEGLQYFRNVGAYIYYSCFAVFWCFRKNVFCGGVLQVSLDGNALRCKVHAIPTQPTRLTTPNACVCSKWINTSILMVLFLSRRSVLQFINGVRFLCILHLFSFSGGWARCFAHRIAGDRIIQLKRYHLGFSGII